MTSSDPSRHLRRLGLDLRPGEGWVCASLFAFHFLLLAFQYTVKSVRQSTFIDSLGAEQLPLAYLLVAICTYPLMVAYQRLACRIQIDHLLASTAVLAACTLPGFGLWFYRAPSSPWPSMVFYVWTSIVGVLLVSQFWSFAGLRLDPRQARRLFASVGAGGILGSVAGGQIARWTASITFIDGSIGPWTALLAATILLLILAIALTFSGSWLRPSPSTSRSKTQSTPSAITGIHIARRSKYLQCLSLGMLFAALVAQIVDLQFAWVVEQGTSSLEQRTAAFGNLYSVMGVAAFLFQLVFTARIHRHLGMGFALRVLPTANGIGSAFFLIAVFLAPGLTAAAIWGLKIAENGLRYSLEQATRELLFLPIPESQRAQAKAFVDVFVQRIAKGLAAVILLTVTFGWMSVPHTAWLALVTVAWWLWVVEKTRRRYVASFRQGLLERIPDQDWAQTLDLRDAATLEILVAGLGSPDVREVCHSLELLSSHQKGHLVPPWILAHDHAEVRLAALDVFRACGREDASPWAEKLLSDPEPAVRAAAIRALASIAPADLCDTMGARLKDQDPKIRAVAAGYLAAQKKPELKADGERALEAMVNDPTPDTRQEAAYALGGLPEPALHAELVQLLYDHELGVTRAAVQAVEQRCSRGRASPLYAPILVSLLRRRRLKHEARAALVAYGELIIPALQHFMFDPGEEIWVRRALPKTLARIGGPRALEALVDGLATRDGLQRQKVIEALGSLRQRGSAPDPSLVEGQIAVECHQFLRIRLDLWCLEAQRKHGSPRLLERLLKDRLERRFSNIFSLLALLHPVTEIRAAYRGIRRNRSDHRVHALEYLDNLLAGATRQRVFAVIDELPQAERLRIAHRLYGLSAPTVAEVLDRYIRRSAGDVDAAWLTAAALWFIHEEGLEDLFHTIRRVAETDHNPVIQETAELLISRMG